jgi:hypothetical protein
MAFTTPPNNPNFPHQQILHTTQISPHVIQKFPLYYGRYQPHAFWEEITAKKKVLESKQRFLTSIWNSGGQCWAQPKVITPPYATICLMFINSDPTDTQMGMPIFKYITLEQMRNVPPNTFDEIYAFARNPNHTFTGRDKDLLVAKILERYVTAAPEFAWFLENWHPAVERHFGHKVDQHMPTYDRNNPFGNAS